MEMNERKRKRSSQLEKIDGNNSHSKQCDGSNKVYERWILKRERNKS